MIKYITRKFHQNIFWYFQYENHLLECQRVPLICVKNVVWVIHRSIYVFYTRIGKKILKNVTDLSLYIYIKNSSLFMLQIIDVSINSILFFFALASSPVRGAGCFVVIKLPYGTPLFMILLHCCNDVCRSWYSLLRKHWQRRTDDRQKEIWYVIPVRHRSLELGTLLRNILYSSLLLTWTGCSTNKSHLRNKSQSKQ